MQVKTILNRLQKHPAFVYEAVRLVEQPQMTLEVQVRPRRGSRATCSHCRRPAPGYDTLPPRCFDFVPLWHVPVVFVYAMRRVSCPGCGVKVEAIPWATGKHRLTDAYAWFLARWAKRLSWREVAARVPPPPGTPSIGPCAWPSTGASRTATSRTSRPSAWMSSRAAAGSAT